MPHDFVVEGTVGPTENRDHGYLPRGVGWYRRTVTSFAVEPGGSALLHFEGAYRDTSVFLDGRLALHHLSGCKTPQPPSRVLHHPTFPGFAHHNRTERTPTHLPPRGLWV